MTVATANPVAARPSSWEGAKREGMGWGTSVPLVQKDKGAKFAKEWIAETKAGYPNFQKLRDKGAAHPIEAVGKRLRSMMKWLAK